MNWPAIPTMGSYAIYVWGSYVLTMAAMGGEVLLLLRRRSAWRSCRHETTS
jgi:heme exporter protein CcmD